jgi:hypothetical protein
MGQRDVATEELRPEDDEEETDCGRKQPRCFDQDVHVGGILKHRAPTRLGVGESKTKV